MQDLANMFPGDCQPLNRPGPQEPEGETPHPPRPAPGVIRHRQPAHVLTYEGAGMKRSLVAPTAGAAAILMALAAGCGSSSGGSASGGSSSGASSSGGSGSGKTYKLSFIQGVAGDGFYVTMGCGMQAEAKKLGNATVNIQGPTKFDPTLQNPIIQSVTASKPDAIMIAPDDVSASQTPVEAAMNAGIKVV